MASYRVTGRDTRRGPTPIPTHQRTSPLPPYEGSCKTRGRDHVESHLRVNNKRLTDSDLSPSLYRVHPPLNRRGSQEL